MLYPKSNKKKKNKHRHISNPRITEWTPCFVCNLEHGENFCKGAYATHEIFHNGSAYMRNISMEYGAQIFVCMDCDNRIHRSDGVLDRKLKRLFQMKIMLERNFTMEVWLKIFYKNYLEES